MDDVDYLVEDKAMDDFFFLSSEMDGTHGRTTFEDDPEQQLVRRQLIVKWHKDGCKLGTKCKCWNVATIISA